VTRTCTICGHERRSEIDRALVGSESFRNIAKRFSVSTSALHRHRNEHIPGRLLKAKDAEELTQADALRAELEYVKSDAERLKTKAEQDGDYKTALSACDRALKALELQAKLAQLINDAPQINLRLSAEWLELRGTIVTSLEPFPEARGAVLSALGSDNHAS
jgi:hypothetical protein